MSFYSYKNANASCCPGAIAGDATNGLQEKVCVQVKRVYDSAMWQEQIDNAVVTITSFAQVNNSGCGTNACNQCQSCNGGCHHCGGSGCDACNDTVAPTSPPAPPITFESCRSSTTQASVRNLSIERLCDRPCFARVRCTVDVPIDILFVDSRCIEYIGKGIVSVDRDVLLSIPDESIVPYTLEAMASAICVSGCFVGNNQFKMTVCVTIVLKVLADVEILVPSYGYCAIPPAEEFADSVCEEFFSLPLFPTASACNNGTVSASNVNNTCNRSCRCNGTANNYGYQGNGCNHRC